MRAILVVLAAGVLLAGPGAATTLDDILAKYIKTVGGMDRIQAVHTLRRTGRSIRGGGFETPVVQENERPGRVRKDVIRQGLVGITAYDGAIAWKIQPWQGKKDPEPLGDEEMKGILLDADFDGPLVNSREKGIAVALVGPDQVEGTDVEKLKVTHPNGDVDYYYLDAEYAVPIKIDSKRMVRGAEREYETMLGDYKAVSGWFLPHAYETRVKGSPAVQQVVYDTIQANVPIAVERFNRPGDASPPGPKP